MDEKLIRKLFMIMASKPLFEVVKRGDYTIKKITRDTISVFTHDQNGTEVSQWYTSETICNDKHGNTQIFETSPNDVVAGDGSMGQLALF